MSPLEFVDAIRRMCAESAASAADMEEAKYRLTGYRDSFQPLLYVQDVRDLLAQVEES